MKRSLGAGATECSVLTVSRGMQVLRAFRGSAAPVTHTELVRRTRLPTATVSRLTSTLLQLGFLRHSPGRRDFELSGGPLAIGEALIGTGEVMKAAEPVLQHLAERLGVSVALAIPNGLDMLYVGYAAGHRVASLRMSVGSLLPMESTAIGHAYLWSLESERRAPLIAELRRAAGLRETEVARWLEESFAELAATRTCSVLGKFQRDAYALATPVRVGRERVLMALSCGRAAIQPDLVAERARIAPVLLAEAARLEELLADCAGVP